MRDQDQPHPACTLHRLQELEDLGLGRHVERRRGLVGDQELRVSCERGSEADPLPHAARELERVAIRRGRVVDADLDETPERLVLRGSPADLPAVAIRSTSSMCFEQRRSGLSIVNGSWKIIEIRLPRSRAASRPLEAQHVAAVEENLAAGHLHAGGQ